MTHYPEENSMHEPYYGNVTRRLLIGAGILMLIGTPFFAEYLPKPLITAIFAAVLLAFVAGFTSPSRKLIVIANLAVSIFAMAAFEAYAVYIYMERQSIADLFFIVSQTLAVIFFLDVYYSSKTVRGMFSGFYGRGEVKKILYKHGKKQEEIRDIFWEIMAGGGSEETAAHIITDAERLDLYLSLRQNGIGNSGAVAKAKKDIKLA